jgi:hypothetical protein
MTGEPPHKPARKRAPSAFRQTDVSRAIAAAQARGLAIQRVEVDPRTARITLVIKDGDDSTEISVNPFDDAPLPDEPVRRTRKTK